MERERDSSNNLASYIAPNNTDILLVLFYKKPTSQFPVLFISVLYCLNLIKIFTTDDKFCVMTRPSLDLPQLIMSSFLSRALAGIDLRHQLRLHNTRHCQDVFRVSRIQERSLCGLLGPVQTQDEAREGPGRSGTQQWPHYPRHCDSCRVLRCSLAKVFLPDAVR